MLLIVYGGQLMNMVRGMTNTKWHEKIVDAAYYMIIYRHGAITGLHAMQRNKRRQGNIQDQGVTLYILTG